MRKIRPLDPSDVRAGLERDRIGLKRRGLLLEKHNVPFMNLYYEDLYSGRKNPASQLATLNAVLAFLALMILPRTCFCGERPVIWILRFTVGLPRRFIRRYQGLKESSLKLDPDGTGWLFR